MVSLFIQSGKQTEFVYLNQINFNYIVQNHNHIASVGFANFTNILCP